MPIKKLKRIFMYKEKALEDPNPAYGVEKIKEIYSNQYAELVNAKINGPEIKDGKAIYKFDVTVGTNG